MTAEDEILHLACAHSRDDLHAKLFLSNLVLASKTHPDMVRDALAEVFDLKAVLEATRRAVAAMNHAMREMAATQAQAREIEQDVRQTLDRMEANIVRLSQVPTYGRKQ